MTTLRYALCLATLENSTHVLLAYSTLDCPVISVYTGDWFVCWETGVRGIKKVAQYLRLTDDGVDTTLKLVLDWY